MGPAASPSFFFYQCGTREGSYEASHFQTAFGLRCLCGAGAAGGRWGRTTDIWPFTCCNPAGPAEYWRRSGGGRPRARPEESQAVRRPEDCLSICVTVSGAARDFDVLLMAGLGRKPWLAFSGAAPGFGEGTSGAPVSVLPK